MKALRFFIEYLKHPKEVGAVAPSSGPLARRMVDALPFQTAECLVELGPGTGSFTREIIRRKRAGTRLILIEKNKSFYDRLQAQYEGDPSVEVVCGSAEHLRDLLARLGILQVDAVLSGLPFTSLPRAVGEQILHETTALLQTRGEFVTFQYSLAKKRLFEAYFTDVATRKVWLNAPPAHVLRCRNAARLSD